MAEHGNSDMSSRKEQAMVNKDDSIQTDQVKNKPVSSAVVYGLFNCMVDSCTIKPAYIGGPGSRLDVPEILQSDLSPFLPTNDDQRFQLGRLQSMQPSECMGLLVQQDPEA